MWTKEQLKIIEELRQKAQSGRSDLSPKLQASVDQDTEIRKKWNIVLEQKRNRELGRGSTFGHN